MKRTLSALAVVTLAATLAACGGEPEGEPPTEVAEPAPESTIMEHDGGSAQPSPGEANLDDDYVPELDPETTVLADMSDQDVTDVAVAAAGGMDAAVEKYGAEAVYVSVVLEESWAMFDAFPELRKGITNEVLAEVGHDACTRIGDGMTLDEIYMADYAETGLTREQDSMFLVADFVWSTILNAPPTLCPEHQAVVTEWEASAH